MLGKALPELLAHTCLDMSSQGYEYKADIERTFYAIGQRLLIPLSLFLRLSSKFPLLVDLALLGGCLLELSFLIAVCHIGLERRGRPGRGMGLVRSSALAAAWISPRGEVGLIVNRRGAAVPAWSRGRGAVMVSVVLFTYRTLLTRLPACAPFT